MFYAISFYVNLFQRDLKIYSPFRIYMIIFGLTRFGIDDPWLHYLL